MNLMTVMDSFLLSSTLFHVLGYLVLFACLSRPIASVNYAWTLIPPVEIV